MVLSAGQGTGQQKWQALSPQSQKRNEAWLELLGAGRGKGKRAGGGRAPPLVFPPGSQARGEVGKALPGISTGCPLKI